MTIMVKCLVYMLEVLIQLMVNVGLSLAVLLARRSIA